MWNSVVYSLLEAIPVIVNQCDCQPLIVHVAYSLLETVDCTQNMRISTYIITEDIQKWMIVEVQQV